MATAISEPVGLQARHRNIPVEAIDAVDGFTPRVERLKQSYLDAQSTVASDRAWFMMESYKKTEGEHPAIRRARALRNVLENMVVTGSHSILQLSDLPPELAGGLAPPEPELDGLQLAGRTAKDVEREHIRQTLDLVAGHRKKAAQLMGIGERTLYRKIKEYGLI